MKLHTQDKRTKKHTLSNTALLHQSLKLGKFVWRDFLHSMIQQVPQKSR